jgi:hypothetical protein
MGDHEQGKLVCCALPPAFCALQLEAGGSWPEGPGPSVFKASPSGVDNKKRSGIARACLETPTKEGGMRF